MKEGLNRKYIHFIIGGILAEIALGILMYYIDFHGAHSHFIYSLQCYYLAPNYIDCIKLNQSLSI